MVFLELDLSYFLLQFLSPPDLIAGNINENKELQASFVRTSDTAGQCSHQLPDCAHASFLLASYGYRNEFK